MADSFPDPSRLAIASARCRLERQWLSQDHAIDGWERSDTDSGPFPVGPGMIDQFRPTLESAWQRKRLAAFCDPSIGDPWPAHQDPISHFWHALIAFLFADNVSLEDDQQHR